MGFSSRFPPVGASFRKGDFFIESIIEVNKNKDHPQPGDYLKEKTKGKERPTSILIVKIQRLMESKEKLAFGKSKD